MSTADRRQGKHDLLGAMSERLQELRNGSRYWHEWHQAGVLLVRLTESAYIQWGLGDSRKQVLLTMLEDARWLYNKAISFLPHEGAELYRSAVLCDDGLAQALHMEYSGEYPGMQPFSELDLALDTLKNVPDGPSKMHQRAIAHAFLARAYWQMRLSQVKHYDLASAEGHEYQATRLFAKSLKVSVNGSQAFRTHLMAMALMHQRDQSGRWRRMAWRAFTLAFREGDRGHMARALAIALFGQTGERWARQVDKRGIVNSIAAQVRDLREQHR